MFPKPAISLLTCMILCLMLAPAYAQNPDLDQQKVTSDKQDLDIDNQKLQHDLRNNTGAVPSDLESLNAESQKIQTDISKVLSDDALEIMKDQQAVNNDYQQLQQDQQSQIVRVPSDEEKINEALKNLQDAQLKLQTDRNLSQSH